MMRLHDLLHDGQPQADSSIPSGEKGIEHFGLILERYAWAVVFNAQEELPSSSALLNRIVPPSGTCWMALMIRFSNT